MKNLFKNKFALTDQGAKDLVKSSIASFLTYAMNMIPAMLLMLFLDQLILAHITDSKIYFIVSVLILIIMYLLLTFEYNSLYNATYRESENMRIDISRTLSNLPLSYFSKHDLSDLAQTIMGDVAAIEHALSHAVAKTIGFIGFFIIISIMLVIGNVKLGLAVLGPILAYFILLLLSKKMQVRNQTKYYHKLRKNAESFQEAIELQQEIKTYNLNEDIKHKLDSEMEEGEKIHIKTELTVGFFNSLAGVVLYLALVLVIIIGAQMLVNQEINILYFIGYLLAAMKLKEATDGIGFNMAELFYIDAMINRVKEIRTTKVQTGKDIALDNFDIQLENVSFGYDQNNLVLENVNFTAKQNQVTALVGKSGCGKTSILRLVSRLYDCNEGTIKIGGKNIKNISLKSLFDNISIVFQDVTLFNESVLENIRVGNLMATDEEVRHAAKLANCDDFIQKLPNGYATKIGENGANLSGGERQRISIARAFLKNSPIIILDEIAASLDVDNEKKIQESLNLLTKNKTVLIISHRLKSIENVDQIVVIDQGVINKVGKHQELLKESSVYNDLVTKTQLAEQFTY